MITELTQQPSNKRCEQSTVLTLNKYLLTLTHTHFEVQTLPIFKNWGNFTRIQPLRDEIHIMIGR